MMRENTETISRSLTQRLRNHLKADEISELAKLVALIDSEGIDVDDVFPYGVSAQPDAVSIRAHLTPDQLAKIGDLIVKLGPVKDLKVFPRGILAPEKYRLHVNVHR
jgi:hypothetical protein